MRPRLTPFRWRPGRERRDLWWFALIALVVLGAGLGLREPWPADEPRFALVGYDMARSGEWFLPQVAGVLYPDKPPVFMWLIGLFYLATGSLRIAFLLPSLLAGLGTLWLVYDLGRRLWNPRIGLAGAALLLVTVQFALQARIAQIDALVTFLVTLGAYGLMRHLLLGPSWGWYALGGLAAGVGIITKGVGFLALLVLLPWAFAASQGWPRLQPLGRDPRFALAPLAMLLAVAAWVVPMLLVVGASGDPAHLAYRDDILFRQTGERYAAAWHHHNPPWFYLVEVIPPFWLPLALLLPWLVPAWWRRLRRHDARYLLPLGTALLILLFFSASPGKRGVYILPMLPLVALSSAPLLPALLRRLAVQRLGALALMLSSVALLVFPLLPKYHALAARYEIDAAILFYALGGTGLAWLLWSAIGTRLAQGMVAFAGFLATLWVVYGVVGHPLLDPARSASALMGTVRAAVPAGAELGLVDWEEQFVLQAGRPILHFGFRRHGKPDEVDDALRWQAAAPGRWLMVPAPKDGACIIAARAADLGFRSRRRWLAVGPEAITAECRVRLAAAGPPAAAIPWSPGPDRSRP